MKTVTNAVILVIALTMFTTAFAADTKVNGRLYADWNLDLTDGAESANSFNVNRAYITVTSKLSDYTSVRITTDIRSTDAFDGYSIILKYGYIDWKPKFGNENVTVRFGLQPTLYFDNMNKLWGRRYLDKTAGDKNKFLTTSDLGASAFLNLGEKGKMGYAAIQILNGTSYTDTEELNKNKNFSGFLLLKPFMNNENLKRSRLIGQAYIGTQNEVFETVVETINNQTVVFENNSSQFSHEVISVGGMLGYSNTLDLGIDMNFLTKGQGYDDMTAAELDDKKSSALSFFGTLYFEGLSDSDSFGRTLNLFGRYDMYDPNTDADDDAKNLFIVGLECNPTKGFKASVNFRNTSYELDGMDSESQLFVNTLFKF